MIRQDKHANALRALSTVLVWARKLAYAKEKYEDIAEILDVAEDLPMLFLRDEDMTDYFREALHGFADKYEGFSLALERFDAPSPS